MKPYGCFLLLMTGLLLIVLVPAAALAAQDDSTAVFEHYFNWVWNAQSYISLPSLVSPDIVHHDATLVALVTGIPAIEGYIKKCLSDLPDIQFTVDSMTVEGDRVNASLTAQLGTASAPLEASGRVQDSKLVETWFDMNSLMDNPAITAAVAVVETANLALIDQFIEINQHLADYTNDMATFNAKYVPLWASSYEYHSPGVQGGSLTFSPVADYTSWYSPLSTAFPDLTWTAENVMAHGDQVTLLYSSTGTFTNHWSANGEGIDLEPTGKPVTETGVYIFRISDGKIVELWQYEDSPLLFVETALMLKRGFSVVDPTILDIYDLNNK